jgi:hypothetical protein
VPAAENSEVLLDEQVEPDRRGPPCLGGLARFVAAMVFGGRVRASSPHRRKRLQPRSRRGCQIVAKRGADATRIGARLQLGGDRIRISVPKNCHRQIPLPAPCKGRFPVVSRRKISLLDNLQICQDEYANYLTKTVLSPIGGTNFEPLCDGFGGFSLSSGKLAPSADLTPRSISPGVVDDDGRSRFCSGVADRLPHLEGCGRHCDVADAERSQRVEDGANHDREGRGYSRLRRRP